MAPAATTDQLDAALPQTHCTQCGFAGCRPYADALAAGEADVDRCPPGGDAGAAALARLLGVAAKPYDRTRGVEKPRAVAVIDEPACVGCTKCIQACPVDAIVGASKLMHAVLVEECTGCELCIPPCPVDCIRMVTIEPSAREEPAAQAWREQLRVRTARARARFASRNARLARDRAERDARLAALRTPALDPVALALARAGVRKADTP